MPCSSVIAVSLKSSHAFTKTPVDQIHLLAGLGVEGDAHMGVTVKHRSRVAHDPTQPNLRQVHFIHAELFDELAAQGLILAPGELGENITTQGLDVLALPVDTKLLLGATAIVRLTGLRNPCTQIENFQPGLLKAVLGRAADGSVIRKAGVMGVVLVGGIVRPGDSIRVELPAEPHRALERV